MTASKRDQIATLEAFFEWLPVMTSLNTSDGCGGNYGEDPAEFIARFADEMLTECDTAIGHGPGHQSISVCIRTGEHSEHVSDMGHEWEDKDIGEQTYDKHNWDGPPGPDGLRTRDTYRTYRLAFEPY